MIEQVHRGLGSFIWRALLLALVLLAVYVTTTRALLQALPSYKDPLIARISTAFGADIRVEALSGEVVGFAPQISLTDLHVTLPGDAGVVVDLSGATLTLDPWQSLLALEPRLDSLRLEGSAISVNVGQLGEADGEADFSVLGDLLEVFRKVTVGDSSITLHGRNNARLGFDLGIELRREGSQRRFKVQLAEDAGSLLVMEGAGIGTLFQPAGFSGEVHGTLHTTQLGSLLALISDEAVTGAADIDFWYAVRGGAPTLTLSAALADLELARHEAPEVVLDGVALNALVRPTEQGWVATIADLQIGAGDAVAEVARLQALLRGQNLKLNLADVNVADVSQVLLGTGLLTGLSQEVVATLAPAGEVVALEISVEDLAQPLVGWSAAAEVVDATTQPYENVPGLYGIDATVLADQSGATAWIDTQGFGLDLPEVYHEVIRFETLRGRLSAHWWRNALFLERGVFAARNGEQQAMAEFGIDIPFDDDARALAPLAMYLDVGIDRAPVSIRSAYIPHFLDEALYNWLDVAVESGAVESGMFSWRGGFEDFGSGRQSMQLSINLTEGQVAFQPDWPAISDLSGLLLIDTDRVSVWGNEGTLSGTKLSSVSVEIDGHADVAAMHVGGAVDGPLSEVMNVLRASPINELAAGLLADLTTAGQVNGSLDLSFDLADLTAEPRVDVEITIADGVLRSELLDLELLDVTGDLRFDSKSGFSTRSLSATVFGSAVDIAIGPGSSGRADGGIFNARFSAYVEAVSLANWLSGVAGLSLPQGRPLPLSGSTSLQVAVVVKDQPSIWVTTDLAGVALDLPAPLGKSAEVVLPLELKLATNDTPWDLFWRDRGQGRLYWRDGAMVGATFDITPRSAPIVLADPVITEGLYLSGQIPEVDLDGWLEAVDGLTLPDVGARDAFAITIDGLQVFDVRYDGTSLGPVTFNLQPFETWDLLGINAQWIVANVTLSHLDEPTLLVINQLDLDALPQFAANTTELATAQTEAGEAVSGASESEKTSSVQVPSDFASPPTLTAPLEVIVANLRRQQRDLGAVAFTLRNEEGGLVVDGLRGSLADVDFLDGSQLRWQDSGDGQIRSSLFLNGEVGDLGRTFRALGIEPAVETRSGKLAASVSWPGGPLDISMTGLTGDLDVQLREGSFLPVPTGATGFVRILSVLNLAGLFERANVTRLFEPGVAFKRAGGVMAFHAGTLEIPDFTVEGPGGGFKFDSDIDLLTETIDGELVVTLPLVDNIPWVAALAGGLPVAAGAYLVSKVFEDQVKSLSSGVYSVTGELAKPDVKFVRVFDATTNKVREIPSDQSSSGDSSSPSKDNDSSSTDGDAAASSSRK